MLRVNVEYLRCSVKNESSLLRRETRTLKENMIQVSGNHVFRIKRTKGEISLMNVAKL